MTASDRALRPPAPEGRRSSDGRGAAGIDPFEAPTEKGAPMATDRRVALMSASLTLAAILGPAALLGARALAFAPPPSPPPLVDTCAPGSCSIVVKTAEGGAPSRVRRTSCFAPGAMVTTGGVATTSPSTRRPKSSAASTRPASPPTR